MKVEIKGMLGEIEVKWVLDKECESGYGLEIEWDEECECWEVYSLGLIGGGMRGKIEVKVN